MATISTPVVAWVSSVMTNTAATQSSNITATINITAGWEVQIPVRVGFLSVSADPIINIYPSMDGGVTYDTTPMTSFSVARVTGGIGQASIRLSTGQYAIQFQNSGPQTATFALLTQIVITAINNA